MWGRGTFKFPAPHRIYSGRYVRTHAVAINNSFLKLTQQYLKVAGRDPSLNGIYDDRCSIYICYALSLLSILSSQSRSGCRQDGRMAGIVDHSKSDTEQRKGVSGSRP